METIEGFENAAVLTELTNGNLATGTAGKNENGKHIGLQYVFINKAIRLKKFALCTTNYIVNNRARYWFCICIK